MAFATVAISSSDIEMSTGWNRQLGLTIGLTALGHTGGSTVGEQKVSVWRGKADIALFRVDLSPCPLLQSHPRSRSFAAPCRRAAAPPLRRRAGSRRAKR